MAEDIVIGERDSDSFEQGWFIPSRYRNSKKDVDKGASEYKEGAPRYLIRGLDSMEAQDITGRVTLVGDRYEFTGDAKRSAISNGLLGWSGLIYKGEELEYGRQNLRFVPAFDLAEIAGEIVDRSNLGGENLKN